MMQLKPPQGKDAVLFLIAVFSVTYVGLRLGTVLAGPEWAPAFAGFAMFAYLSFAWFWKDHTVRAARSSVVAFLEVCGLTYVRLHQGPPIYYGVAFSWWW